MTAIVSDVVDLMHRYTICRRTPNVRAGDRVRILHIDPHDPILRVDDVWIAAADSDGEYVALQGTTAALVRDCGDRWEHA